MAGTLTDLGRRWLLIVALLAVGWAAGGLAGARAYWDSYYVHRGFPPTPRLPHSGVGRVETVYFHSSALHRLADYKVYLPPRYGHGGRRYPVLYLLHGSPGGPSDFLNDSYIGVRLANLISLHRARPMILVFPDGRIGGRRFSDSEWANSRAGNYESYVINVVADVDRRFAALASRQDRVIGGLSEGAYGAMNIALHHLSMFGGVQAWSGYFVETRSGVFARATRAELIANSPLEYVHKLARSLSRYPLWAFLYSGRRDKSAERTPQMAHALAEMGVDAHYAIYPGGHDWQLWNAHVDQMVQLASRWFGARAPSASH